MAALDSAGHLIAQYEVTVSPSHFSANQAQAAIARMIPGGRIAVQPATKGLLLTGLADNPNEAAQAVALARGFIGVDQTVENQITI